MSATIPAYDPAGAERRAQRRWEQSGSFKARAGSKRRRVHCQSFFPSLAEPLQMGDCRKLVVCDIIARYKRMHGFDVIQPAGWDGFGSGVALAAKERGMAPKRFEATMRRQQQAQMRRLGLALDFAHEIDTTEPRHQAWLQRMFIDMWQAEPALVGRAKKPGVVYWDPGAGSVIPTRRLVSGRGPESGMLIEIRKVDSYEIPVAKQVCVGLLERLEKLGSWDVFVRNMQRESIGLEDGITVSFALTAPRLGALEPLAVFTSRPDTIMGTTYLAVAADHPLAHRCAEDDADVAAFCAKALRPAHAYERIGEDKSQDGLPLGVYAINPINGDHLPVWVTNFVVASYGTGAALGVPAHDQRNFNFARRHNLPLRRVALGAGEGADDPIATPFTGRDGEVINSGRLASTLNALKRELLAEGSGEQSFRSKRRWDRAVGAAVLAFLKERKVAAGARTETRLRGWKISQQDYWGCPVPLVHCPSCGTVPAARQDLPILPPAYRRGKDNLADYPGFAKTSCPRCKGPAKRDTDTLASLFTTAVTLAHQDCAKPGAAGRARLPVDYYCCGVEHATTHLLCASIMHALMRRLGKLPATAGAAPFTNLLCQGPVLNYGLPMDASYGNAIEASTLLDLCGADLVRLYLATSVDVRHQLHWDEGRLFALQGRLSFAEYQRLRRDELEGAAATRAREVLGRRDFARLQRGLLSREQLAQLRGGRLTGAPLAAARRILGAGGLRRLQHGLLGPEDVRALRRGRLAAAKSARLGEIVGAKALAELQRTARAGGEIEGCLTPAAADRVLGYVPAAQMDRLEGFVAGDKLEQLVGFCGRLWLGLLSKRGLLAAGGRGRARGSDPRLERLAEALAAIDACYAGRDGKGMQLSLHRLTGKLREILRMIEEACDDADAADVRLVQAALPALLKVAHPVIPHVTERIWQLLKLPGVLAAAAWPRPSRARARRKATTYVIQENGARRLELSLAATDPRSKEVLARAREALEERARRNGATFPKVDERIIDHKYGFARDFVVINFVTAQAKRAKPTAATQT